MATQQSKDSTYQEGRIELAIQAFKSGKFKSIRAAAIAYDVPEKTTRRRASGITAKGKSPAPNRKLSTTEEISLREWALSMDKRGMPLRIATMRQMADLLIAKRYKGTTSSTVKTTTPTVGQHWVQNFIKRDNDLQSKYNRKYDYQRAKCEDPRLIREWFKRVHDTVEQYGIVPEDYYNFDETGFQMGIISTSKVVTGTDRAGRPRTVQPGNREWVTAIEAISACGYLVPPLIIFEAIMHQEAWYKTGIPGDWSIGVSPNGWTNDKIGLFWLKEVFDRYTRSRTVGRYRLLVFDGHGSHVTPEFDQYCTEHNIIVLCMPPHSSHLLQPLDVSCFSVLKRAYGQGVEELMRRGVNHVDKLEFLPLYHAARTKALHAANIKASFKAAGLVPHNPDRVLAQFNTEFHTPSPPPLPSSEVAWISETPHDIIELEKQTDLIKHYLYRRTHTPPSPTLQAINQLVKGCALAMNGAVLMASHVEGLEAENKKQKRKQGIKRKYIARSGVLSVANGISLSEREKNVQVERQEDAELFGTKPRSRAPSRCSLCRALEHTARICPQSQPIN